jgi:transcriptional regulator with XRE-family HTH domain
MNRLEKSGEERLGHYVMVRRTELGYNTRQDLANVLGITIRTLSDIEHGIRRASPGSYAMLEAKLGWKPGACTAILAGLEPALITENAPANLTNIPTDELLLELRRRTIPSDDSFRSRLLRGPTPDM